MDEMHSIIDVTAWSRIRDEAMGSKPKFWLRDPAGRLWLFKYPRLNTGEHWSEKLAAEVARALNLPHAEVELAVYRDSYGSLGLDFTAEGLLRSLVHGNELMYELDPEYPIHQTFKVAKHTLDRIFDALDRSHARLPRDWTAVPGITTAGELFAGYLLLDALIGNGDRHHENWGVIEEVTDQGMFLETELAPTFDHASCLGRELADTQRLNKLGPGRAAKDLARYASRARSAIYATEDDPKPMTPLKAWLGATVRFPHAGLVWREQLEMIGPRLVETLGNRLPPAVASAAARSFAQAFLKHNLAAILDCR